MPKYKRTRCGVSYLTTLTTVSILSLPVSVLAQTITVGSGEVRTTNINGDTVEINGTLTTSGNDLNGISSTGADAEISVGASGEITTSGNSAHGIRSEGTSATITSDGEITTSGESAHGIRS